MDDHVLRLLNGFPVPLGVAHLDVVVSVATHSRTLMANADLARLLGITPNELAVAMDDLTARG